MFLYQYVQVDFVERVSIEYFSRNRKLKLFANMFI